MSQHVFNLLDNIWKCSEGDREQCSSDVSLFYSLVGVGACVCVCVRLHGIDISVFK